MDPNRKTPQNWHLERARLLFGCYRRDDAADPEVYGAAVAAVLAEYTPGVVERVTDPRTGLASRCKWLPSVAEVVEACNGELAKLGVPESRRKAAEYDEAARRRLARVAAEVRERLFRKLEEREAARAAGLITTVQQIEFFKAKGRLPTREEEAAMPGVCDFMGLVEKLTGRTVEAA